MKHIISIFLLIVIALNISSQEIIEDDSYKSKTTLSFTEEEYYKSKTKLSFNEKNDKYKKTTIKYIDGVKFVNFIYLKTGQPIWEKQYWYGMPDGIWKVWKKNGKLTSSKEYNRKQHYCHINSDGVKRKFISNGEINFPGYNGVFKGCFLFLSEHIQYEQPILNGGEATVFELVEKNSDKIYELGFANACDHVVIRFLITKDGEMESPCVWASMGWKYDKLVLRIVRGMKDWKPAKLNGEAIDCIVLFPFKFCSVTYNNGSLNYFSFGPYIFENENFENQNYGIQVN
jgi:antitoxin component YwqK of YwqJK toxin-antitoxin module